MQIANVKHSHCEAKFAACGKPNLGAYTAKQCLPGLGVATVIFLKLTPMVRLGNREEIPQQKPYWAWGLPI